MASAAGAGIAIVAISTAGTPSRSVDSWALRWRAGCRERCSRCTTMLDSVPTACDHAKLNRLFFENNKFASAALAGAPIRSSPLRTYDPVRLVQDPQGVSTPAFLANLHARNPDEWLKMKGGLEEFGRTSGLFDEIFIRRLGRYESEPFQVEVRKSGKRRKGAKRNLIDVGYGVSQVLPLLVDLLDPSGASLFLVQQPEVHLHPSAQAALGSLFCRIAASGRQLIVETHSEYIIDRVRMDIRDRTAELEPGCCLPIVLRENGSRRSYPFFEIR